MKKWILLLMALPLLCFLSSCNDEDSLPNVDIDVHYSNGIVSQSQVYVVKPDTLYIEGVTVEAVNPNHDAAVVGLVTYRIDGFMPGIVAYPNERVAILTENMPLGTHILTAEMGIAEEGCALSRAFVSVAFHVVSDESEIPGNPSDWKSVLPVEAIIK